MMQPDKTITQRPVLAPDALLLPVHPVLQRVYAHRGISSVAELARTADKLLPYQKLKGMDTAVSLLLDALRRQAKIIIVGEFRCRWCNEHSDLAKWLSHAGLFTRRLSSSQSI